MAYGKARTLRRLAEFAGWRDSHSLVGPLVAQPFAPAHKRGFESFSCACFVGPSGDAEPHPFHAPFLDLQKLAGMLVVSSLDLALGFPSVRAVWRRWMKGDSALVWLDDRVH
jgi:hypothetical protein